MRQLIRPALLLSVPLLLVASLASAKTYPEPSKYPIAWELKFTHSLPKRIVVELPDKGAVAYWYMTYNVANLGDQEQQFLPTFELVTNEGAVARSDFAIPVKVFEKIKSTEGNSLLERLPKIAGPVRPGEDQSKDGVAIWPEPEARMGAFTIFVGGLSGEFVTLKDADGKPQTDSDGSPVILRKTLQLDFAIYGDEIKPNEDEVHAKGERWVMR